MRYLFIILFSTPLFAQTNPFATAALETFEPITRDTVHIKTLSMLSKIDEGQMSLHKQPLDINYNWTRDINRINFYDRMGFGIRRSDIYGREFMPDIIQTVTFPVLVKTTPTR